MPDQAPVPVPVPPTPAPASAPSPAVCPACGAEAVGNFCARCGASLGPRRCAACTAELSTRARFCHRCGRPVNAGPARPGAARGRSDRTPWLIAGALAVLLVGAIIWRIDRGTPAPVIPDMANPGAGQAPFAGGPGGDGVAGGRAPDISAMSPRERFDRLFNRVMTAAERGDSATTLGFMPMALAAYSQLDTIDADARYHAALLLLQVDSVRGALALADTIERNQPGHLLGYLARGAAAERAQNDTMRRQAYRDFLAHYDAERKSGRVEYREHEAAIDAFRQQAQQAVAASR